MVMLLSKDHAARGKTHRMYLYICIYEPIVHSFAKENARVPRLFSISALSPVNAR